MIQIFNIQSRGVRVELVFDSVSIQFEVLRDAATGLLSKFDLAG